MRNKSLELEIRMSRKPNVSGKGKLYVHGGAQDDAAERPAEARGADRKTEGEENV